MKARQNGDPFVGASIKDANDTFAVSTRRVIKGVLKGGSYGVELHCGP